MAKETGLEEITYAEPSSHLRQLAETHYSSKKISYQLLKGDGSDRRIYLITSDQADLSPIIGVLHQDTDENRSFIEISKKMKLSGIPVPEVKLVASCETAYLLQYLGPHNLAESIEVWKTAAEHHKIIPAYKTVLDYLHLIQTRVTPRLTWFLKDRKMGPDVITGDLVYCRNDFFDRFGLSRFLTPAVRKELQEHLIDPLSNQPADVFVYRDFQSRNIMWYQSSPWFIDYQSAFLGTPYYDLASLLYGSKSGLDDASRIELLAYHHQTTGIPLSYESFEHRFFLWVLLRRLRSLGSYGYLSQEKGKRRFFASIEPTLQELIALVTEKNALKPFSHTREMLRQVAAKWHLTNCVEDDC